ncbi:hypothetical protein G6F60_007919 [Rhizopus arrhizus]|nr:hypothetical protein G6F66_010753 [Rhizopus arrhizus]KAG1372746.1 hypothetical protein G6F61_010778 [Rhizopus arrhizus]KAG1399124.1 hypothetical protein G6F60_007919 [Rhizopus arrhizus]
MRNNWARSKSGSSAIAKQPKNRAQLIPLSGLFTRLALFTLSYENFHQEKKHRLLKKKRNVNNGKKRTAIVICTVDPEVDDDPADNKPTPKGATTAHFIKFMNELLDVMDLDETFKGSYIVMDNASIHKSKPMLQKIESKGYKVMYLPPYSPELNPIEQFWAIVKGEMKRDRLMSEENLSSRIGDACNAVLISDLYSFCSHSKRQIIKCYNKTPF